MTEKKQKQGDGAAAETGSAGADAQTAPAATDERDLGIPESNPYAHIAGDSFTPQPAGGKDLLERIRSDPRMHDHLDGFMSCVQCGVCTSGCPAARFTEYSPRETARRALDGDETLLTDETLWYCFYCYTCQSRCPRHNSVAVINQVVRGMQVESGVGVKHVEMFSAWGEQYYDKGMGGTPQVFFQDIADMCGPKWKEYMAHRDELRDRLGLGSAYPSEQATKELRVIMEETGFKDRLESIGAWGGHRPGDAE